MNEFPASYVVIVLFSGVVAIYASIRAVGGWFALLLACLALLYAGVVLWRRWRRKERIENCERAIQPYSSFKTWGVTEAQCRAMGVVKS